MNLRESREIWIATAITRTAGRDLDIGSEIHVGIIENITEKNFGL